VAKFDPSSNGHRTTHRAAEVQSRGRDVLTIFIVSAAAGMGLLVGVAVGLLATAALHLRGAAFVMPVAAAAGITAAAGIWYGVEFAARVAGQAFGKARRVWRFFGGVAGLVGSVALASKGALGPLTPIVSISLPGLGALFGQRAGEHFVRPRPGPDT
jgi:hypothetical protein